MTELKTLEDFELDRFYGGTEEGYRVMVRLKAEAIKWIKSDIEQIRKLKRFNISKGIGENIPLKNILNEDMGFIRTWMERLNITEEDLKGGEK